MGRRGWLAALLVIGLSIVGWGAVRLALFIME